MPRLCRLLIIGICSVIFFVACGDFLEGDRSFNSLEGDKPSAAEYCRLVEHQVGKTEVCGQPQNVAVISPYLLDTMLALGVQPAAFAQAVNPRIQIFDNPTEQIPYVGKWVTSNPIGLGSRNTPSLERLTLLKPDLILGESWQGNQYDLMTQIAPTLMFSDQKNPDRVLSWEQNIVEVAQALGRAEKVEDLRAAHAAQIAQARAALQPVLQAYPRVFLMSSNVGLTQPKSGSDTSLLRLLQEIGFEIVPPPGFTGSRVPLSLEVIPEIESDLMFVAGWDDDLALNPEESTPEATVQGTWKSRPVLNTMPVFQLGRVFFVDYYLWGGVVRGPLSDQIILEALPDLLLPVVENPT
ncbi:MAG: ABC transporter substrate-binding protein [Cyanobacteria bacterium J06621_8]